MDRKTTALVTLICAVAVGNLYYVQPVLVEVAQTFGAASATVGLVATLAQVGYGLGVLFVVPLGDVLERRGLIAILLLGVACAMGLSGAAPSLPALMAGNFLVGLTTVTPQILIPYAAATAAPGQRATVLGTVQSGLLIGILVARTFAGGIAAAWGWRSVFWVGAAMSAALAGVVRFSLVSQPPAQHVAYPKLLRSMGTLFVQEPVLRQVSLASGLNFAAFSAFWTCLAFLLDDAFHLGPAAVGLFGLIGVAGALGARVAGRIADKFGASVAQHGAMWLTAASFAVLFAGGYHLAALVVGVVLMDAGVQAAHLAFQADVFALRQDARSRLNGIYMFFRFLGGAMGSLIGAWAWGASGWAGVCAAGALFSLAARLAIGKDRGHPHLTSR